MILVTGAAGKTGRALVRALAARGAAVRALVFRPAHTKALAALGAHDVVVADMREAAQVSEAARGVDKLYHICPNIHPEEVAIGEHVIAAARAHGCRHLVYHSVLHPQTEAMPHHWLKLQVEQRLFESGLPFTILQPAPYLQNLLGSWQSIREHGIYPVPYAADTRLSMVDLDDVAQAGASVLTGSGHEGACYELSGPEALTQHEVAETIGRHLGRRVRVEVVPRSLWKARARKKGIGGYQADALEKMFAYYERYDFIGNANLLAWLLGRRPTTLAGFLARVVQQQPRP